MFRLLIVPALVAAQLFTWAGGSLYMCVACDGSVGIDLGPGQCDRCHGHDHAAGELRHEHGCGCGHESAVENHDHALGLQAGHGLAAGGPCDCRHVLISHEQSLSASRQTGVEQSLDHLLHAGASAVGLPAPLAHVQQVTRGHSVAGSVEHSPQLAAISSIVLRC